MRRSTLNIEIQAFNTLSCWQQFFFPMIFPLIWWEIKLFKGFYRLYTIRDLGITQFPSFLFPYFLSFSSFFFEFFLLFFSKFFFSLFFLIFFLFFFFFSFTNKGKRLQGLHFDKQKKNENYKRLWWPNTGF